MLQPEQLVGRPDRAVLGQVAMYIRGAPEGILGKYGTERRGSRIVPLTEEGREAVIRTSSELAGLPITRANSMSQARVITW
jgi:hypothetical protein